MVMISLLLYLVLNYHLNIFYFSVRGARDDERSCVPVHQNTLIVRRSSLEVLFKKK